MQVTNFRTPCAHSTVYAAFQTSVFRVRLFPTFLLPIVVDKPLHFQVSWLMLVLIDISWDTANFVNSQLAPNLKDLIFSTYVEPYHRKKFQATPNGNNCRTTLNGQQYFHEAIYRKCLCIAHGFALAVIATVQSIPVFPSDKYRAT